jgi:hypothetical protein
MEAGVSDSEVEFDCGDMVNGFIVLSFFRLQGGCRRAATAACNVASGLG